MKREGERGEESGGGREGAEGIIRMRRWRECYEGGKKGRKTKNE